MSITPLRKKTLEGAPYRRDAGIEAKLRELFPLSTEELIARCSVQRRDDPDYVPSECLLYFVRVCREAGSDAGFEQLYKILTQRVLRQLPTRDGADGKALSVTKSRISDEVFGRFAELLAMDRAAYCEKLDYFEVRFDGALASLRRDAQSKVWRDENQAAQLGLDEETGALSAEGGRAPRNFNPFDTSELDDADYRSRLDEAIDSLPLLQRRIVEMLLQEIPIDSIEPDAITIAKTLGKSEKTIRTHRDKAFAALAVALREGELR